MSDNDKRILASQDPEEVYQEDYHGHPKYLGVYIWLVVILLITLIPNIVNFFAGHEIISAAVLKDSWYFVVFAIFAFSTWKAILVMRNFMHIKFEPMMVFGMVFVSILCLVFIFILVFPDISKIYEPNTRFNIDHKAEYTQGERKDIKHVIVEEQKISEPGVIEKKFDLKKLDEYLHPKHGHGGGH